MSRKPLAKDVPWRASSVKPIPKIHLSPLLRVATNPTSAYALAIIKVENPVGNGLAIDAIVESAGPECIVPGQVAPIKLLGLKVWPIEVDLKFLEPVGRELQLLGKLKIWPLYHSSLVHGQRRQPHEQIIYRSLTSISNHQDWSPTFLGLSFFFRTVILVPCVRRNFTRNSS